MDQVHQSSGAYDLGLAFMASDLYTAPTENTDAPNLLGSFSRSSVFGRVLLVNGAGWIAAMMGSRRHLDLLYENV